MPKALVEIRLSESGPSILVESTTSEGSVGFVDAAADGGLVLKAERYLTDALASLGTMTDAVLQQLSGVVQKPKTAVLEFGIKFGAKGSVIIAGGEAEANCKISLTWEFPSKAGPDDQVASSAS